MTSPLAQGSVDWALTQWGVSDCHEVWRALKHTQPSYLESGGQRFFQTSLILLGPTRVVGGGFEIESSTTNRVWGQEQPMGCEVKRKRRGNKLGVGSMFTTTTVTFYKFVQVRQMIGVGKKREGCLKKGLFIFKKWFMAQVYRNAGRLGAGTSVRSQPHLFIQKNVAWIREPRSTDSAMKDRMFLHIKIWQGSTFMFF